MGGRVFLDTNLIVYAFDDRNRSKQARAWRLLEEAGQDGRAVISTQVLQEFYVIVTRKLVRPLPEDEAEHALRLLARLPVVQVDTPMVLSAARMSRQERLSFWDALIVKAAIEGGCSELLSEDFQDGRKFGALSIRSPFRD
jgi:predicted nucleic acid-binding protein